MISHSAAPMTIISIGHLTSADVGQTANEFVHSTSRSYLKKATKPSFYMNLNQQQARNSGIQSSSGLKETRSEKLRFILGHPLARCSIRGQFWLIPARLLLFYCNDLS